MNTARILALSGMVALGAAWTATEAVALPVAALEQAAVGPLVDVRHRGRPHRAYRAYPRTRLYVTPGAYDYPSPAQLYYGTSRGFQDPGYAYHGNLSGCATDLGYGRWESCDR